MKPRRPERSIFLTGRTRASEIKMWSPWLRPPFPAVLNGRRIGAEPVLLDLAALLACEEESWTPAVIVLRRAHFILKPKRAIVAPTLLGPLIAEKRIEATGEITVFERDMIEMREDVFLRRTESGTELMLSIREYLLRMCAYLQDGVSIVCHPGINWIEVDRQGRPPVVKEDACLSS